MRIVHVCLRYPPAIGGVETYVQRLAEETHNIEAGRDVRVLTSKLNTHHPPSELDPNLLLDDPVYVQRLHHARTPLLAYPRLQALSYYLKHHQPNIIHGYSFWYQPADVAAQYARRHRLPFIFHPLFYTNRLRRKLIWRLYAHTRGRSTFRAASAVVVISPLEKELIIRHAFPVRRFFLIPPGVASHELTTPQPSPYLKYGITGRVVLAVSRLAPGKGLEQAITALPEVVRRHPDVQLAIIGPDFGLKQTLVSLVNALNLADRIRLLGPLPRGQLVGALQHAAVFLHPSHYEAFGIAVAEALAAGTPVVARATAAIPYVAPHEKAALLFTTSQQMVSHLNTFLSDTSLAQRLAHFGQQRIQQEFTWAKASAKLLQLYHELS